MTWLIKYTGCVSGCNEDGMRIKRGGAVTGGTEGQAERERVDHHHHHRPAWRTGCEKRKKEVWQSKRVGNSCLLVGNCRNPTGMISLSCVRDREQMELMTSQANERPKGAKKRPRRPITFFSNTGSGLTTEPLLVWDSAARSVPVERIALPAAEGSAGSQRTCHSSQLITEMKLTN